MSNYKVTVLGAGLAGCEAALWLGRRWTWTCTFWAPPRRRPTAPGAITAAYGIVPELCVAVDVTHGDSPDGDKGKTFPLGGGTVIGLGPNCTRWMSRRLQHKAEEAGMDCQIEVMAGHSGTNGWPLQVSREGVATAVLSLPLRYMHTPIEVISRRDLEDLARLLAAFVETCPICCEDDCTASHRHNPWKQKATNNHLPTRYYLETTEAAGTIHLSKGF